MLKYGMMGLIMDNMSAIRGIMTTLMDVTNLVE